MKVAGVVAAVCPRIFVELSTVIYVRENIASTRSQMYDLPNCGESGKLIFYFHEQSIALSHDRCSQHVLSTV
jgi:hypothetical protein